MAQKKKKVARSSNSIVDVRGLGYVPVSPNSIDPHNFYGSAHKKILSESTGVERFIFTIIPYDVIKSFAIAMDPTAKFKVSWARITPVQRTRLRYTLSLGKKRYLTSWYHTSHHSTVSIGLGHFSGWIDDSAAPTPDGYALLTSQGPLKSSTKDTTSRTRPVNSVQGEFEHFKPTFHCPGYTIAKVSATSSINYSGYPDMCFGGVKSTAVGAVTWHGPCIRVDETSMNGLLADEQAYSSALMQKHLPSMLSNIGARGRSMTLFREVVELRDLPRGILQLKDTLSGLARTFDTLQRSSKFRPINLSLSKNLDDVPKEYISYNFGWAQIYRAVLDLLVKPDKLAKRIAYLQERSGLPTTHKLRRVILSKPAASPSFLTEHLGIFWESVPTLTTTSVRETELKMVVNTTFDFPTIKVPEFKQDLFLHRLGVYPTFTDLYNLVPWTWLVDWFTGMGNYISVIESINTDPSLINWGFLTAKSRSTFTVQRRSTTINQPNFKIVQGVNKDYTFNTYNNLTGVLDVDFQLRKGIGSVYGVKTLMEPENLSPYQQSILGALLAMRTPIRRRPTIL